MKTLFTLFLVVYFWESSTNPFACKIRYKREGTSEIKVHSCLWGKTDTLKKRLEDETGEEIELVEVKSL